MIVTSRGNISNLKYCSYPTIRSFHLFIQLFDVKFLAIAPHILVVFQLKYARHVKNELSIDKHIYTWKLCKLRKKTHHIHRYNIQKNKIVWVNMLSCLSFKPYAKSISLCVRLAYPLCSTSLTNVATPYHNNLPLLDCIDHSIHTFIQSILFAMYKSIASHSRPTVLK
jgi:hypothetical protein